MGESASKEKESMQHRCHGCLGQLRFRGLEGEWRHFNSNCYNFSDKSTLILCDECAGRIGGIPQEIIDKAQVLAFRAGISLGELARQVVQAEMHLIGEYRQRCPIIRPGSNKP